MRIGTKPDNEFFRDLAQKADQISKLFQKNIEILTKPKIIKVMLGDTTVTEQTTFEPKAIEDFYNMIIGSLPTWNTEGVFSTSNEDLRRIFLKLEFKAGNYSLLWNLSLQYHALLYYKPDISVQKIQKELAEIMDKTADKEAEIANLIDDLIRQKLATIGHIQPNEQELFEILFSNDKLRQEILDEIDKKTDFDFKAKEKRKKELFSQLDNLLVETYRTTSILIDENRLIAGEEGCLCTFDLNHIKNKISQSIFEPARIPAKTRQQITDAMSQAILAISKLGNSYIHDG